MKYLATINDREYAIEIVPDDDRYKISLNGKTFAATIRRLAGSDRYSILLDNESHVAELIKKNGTYEINYQGEAWNCQVEDERLAKLKRSIKAAEDVIVDHEIKSPMPGLIVEIEVKPGQTIQRGQGLMIIEAMKMENEIKAPSDAVVKKIAVQPGQTVEMGQTLLLLDY